MSKQATLKEILNNTSVSDAQRLQMIKDLYKQPEEPVKQPVEFSKIIGQYAVSDPHWAAWLNHIKKPDPTFFKSDNPDLIKGNGTIGTKIDNNGVITGVVKIENSVLPEVKVVNTPIPQPAALKWVPATTRIAQQTQVEAPAGPRTRTLPNGATVTEVFNASGTLKKIVIVRQVDGAPLTTTMWYDQNGQTERIETHKTSPFGKKLRHGLFRSWYSNGQLQFVGEYKDDVQKPGTVITRYYYSGLVQFTISKDQNGLRTREEYNDNPNQRECRLRYTTLNDRNEGAYVEYAIVEGKWQPRLIANYKNGILSGRHVHYQSHRNCYVETWAHNHQLVGPTILRQGAPDGPITNFDFTTYRRDACPDLSITDAGLMLA